MPEIALTRRPRNSSAVRRCGAVIASYLRRPWFWAWPVCVAAGLGWLAWYVNRNNVIAGPNAPQHDGLVFSGLLLAWAAGMLSTIVTGHAVQLLAAPRAHLVPRLRGAVLSVTVV